jgi:type VI secretion system protein ImpC
MSDPQKAQAAAQEQTLELGLLDQIVEQGRVGTDTASKERGKSLVKEFVQQVLQGR